MENRTKIRKQIGKLLQRIQFLEIMMFHAEAEEEYDFAVMWAESIYKYRLHILALQRLL